MIFAVDIIVEVKIKLNLEPVPAGVLVLFFFSNFQRKIKNLWSSLLENLYLVV